MHTPKTYKQNLALENLPGEKWKSIPSLDGVCELSNYGRVKSLRRWVERLDNRGFWKKERILRNRVQEQSVSKGKRKLWLLSNAIGFEGKKYSFQLGRLVYYLFVKKFELEDRSIFIGYKDGNPFNLHYDNLFLTSPSKTITQAYLRNHRPRESFGNKARAIVQFDKSGKKLATHLSVYAASKKTGIGMGAINSQLNYGIGYTGGFIWKYEKEIRNNKEILTISIRNKIASEIIHGEIVSQYDLMGKKLREYKNIKEAAEAVNIQINQIRYVMMGKLQTAAGYYWKLGKGENKVTVRHIGVATEKWKEKICRPVSQYDLQGNLINYYNSIAEAGKETGIISMSIFSALKDGGSRTCKNFMWRYGKGKKKINVPKRIKRKQDLEELYLQPVTQYTLNGKRIFIHKNLKEAVKKVKGQVYGLVAMILGKSLSYQGFYWKLGRGKKAENVDNLKKAIKTGLKKIPKPVIQYTIQGKKIKEYSSAMAAEAATGIYATHIGMAVRGKCKSAKGFKWKYKTI